MYPNKDPIPLLPPKKSGKLRTYCPSSQRQPHSARFTGKVSLEAIEFNWHDINCPSMWICYLDTTGVENKDRFLNLPILDSHTHTNQHIGLPANEWVLIDRNKAREVWDFLANSSSWILTNRGENWKEIPV